MTAGSQRLVEIAIGVVLGVAGTLIVMRLLRDPGTTSTTSTTASSNGSASATSPSSSGTMPAGVAEVAALRVRVAELETALRTAGGGSARAEDEPRHRSPDAEHGMSTSTEWWDSLPRVPAWDGPRQQLVIDRLAKLGVKLDAKHVECRKRCCRLTLSDEVYDEHLDEITSSVGLGISPPDGMGTSNHGDEYLVTQCWSQQLPAAPIPDRAIERDALLGKVASEIQKCGQGVSPAITLKLWLEIDEDGQITKVQSNKTQLGSRAAACAETAILAAVAFAPSPMSTDVPIAVVIGT